jgi:putative flippase GtrA
MNSIKHLEKTKGLIKFLYQHPVLRYIFVGGSTFVIDFCLLVILHGKLDLNLAVATTIAYWTSIIYNFILNRRWTFSAADNTRLRDHLPTYLIMLGLNYLFTVLFVSVVSHHINYAIAKAIAVLTQTTWTYFIYKNYIFITHPKPSAHSEN